MKVLNIKIPISIAQHMEDSGRLNSQYLTDFVVTNLNKIDSIVDRPIIEMTYTYSFKVPADLHYTIKLHSVECGISMNDIVGRLFTHYYGEQHG